MARTVVDCVVCILLLHITTTTLVTSLSFSVLQGKRVLVVGGSGRVGGSVVTTLAQHGTSILVGGTSRNRFQASQQRWISLFPNHQEALNAIDFVTVDRECADQVFLLLQNIDLVVHTAGPFQNKQDTTNGILQACVEANVPYIDVCDDYATAVAAKRKYAASSVNNNQTTTTLPPCILSTGCWPGVSSLMAKQLTEAVYQVDPTLTPRDLKVDFSFFTAG
jgi:saccharopine dehydrogenase-like NADP-dependent oxidoreductase